MLNPKERKKRREFKKKLVKRSILPNNGKLTKQHEKIMDMLKASKYNDIKIYVKEYFNHDLDLRFRKTTNSTTREKKISHKKKANSTRSPFKISMGSILKLTKWGFLAKENEEPTPIQTEIYEKIMAGAMMNDITDTYTNHANDEYLQSRMFTRIKTSYRSRKTKGLTFDLEPKNILINKKCPFLGTDLDYSRQGGHKAKITDTQASNDRLNNSKGYVDGNVWVISRLANTIKSDATIDELKTFCINIIKIYHEDVTNNRL
jgi:hypothetical protein